MFPQQWKKRAVTPPAMFADYLASTISQTLLQLVPKSQKEGVNKALQIIDSILRSMEKNAKQLLIQSQSNASQSPRNASANYPPPIPPAPSRVSDRSTSNNNTNRLFSRKKSFDNFIDLLNDDYANHHNPNEQNSVNMPPSNGNALNLPTNAAQSQSLLNNPQYLLFGDGYNNDNNDILIDNNQSNANERDIDLFRENDDDFFAQFK